jgi:rubrerythrin
MPTTDANMNIQRTLELCEQIERCNAEIYRHFAKTFANMPEMAALWHKTAIEEENHAHQFTLAMKLQHLNVIKETTVDQLKADTFLAHVKSVYEGVLAANPSKFYALVTALNLEEKLAAFHANAVAIFVDESFKKLFTAMMKADREHIDAIQRVYHKLTVNHAE